MRKLVCILALAAAAWATTITGTVQYPNGQPFSGTIVLSLTTPGISAGAVLVPGATFAVVNGALPANATVAGNDVIQPAGTEYRAQFYDPYGNLCVSIWPSAGFGAAALFWTLPLVAAAGLRGPATDARWHSGRLQVAAIRQALRRPARGGWRR